MHIAIIGNGISGITAARYIRKFSDHQITFTLCLQFKTSETPLDFVPLHARHRAAK